MCVKVLHVLNFKMMMWIEKYMCRCTLYEKAIYTILQLRDKANLTENDGEFIFFIACEII